MKQEQWAITLPAPLVISADITDEDIIKEMTGALTDLEVSSIISSAFEPANKTYLVNCAKEDLYDMVKNDNDKYIIELQEFEDMFMIIVLDNEENVVGRGEIVKAGKKVTKENFKKEFIKNINDFDKKYTAGQKRMNTLIYKLKMIKTAIESTDPNFSNN